jgi:hypothetical protein
MAFAIIWALWEIALPCGLCDTVSAGPKKRGVAISMITQRAKDALRARFAGTGGWGFEGFAAGDRARPVVGKDAATACFGCHTAQKDRDYVFSIWRE